MHLPAIKVLTTVVMCLGLLYTVHSEGPVEDLNPLLLQQLATNPEKAALVHFYNLKDWLSTRIVREYDFVADKFAEHRGFVVAAIDSTAYPEVERQYRISTPCLLLFMEDGKKVPYPGMCGDKKHPEPEYMTSDEIVQFVEEHLHTLPGRKVHAETDREEIISVEKVKGTNVVELTDANFWKVVERNNTVALVMFYATWCSHCKATMPTLTSVASFYDMDSRVVVGRLDAELYNAITSSFDVVGFPTLFLFSTTLDGQHQREKYAKPSRSFDDMVASVADLLS